MNIITKKDAKASGLKHYFTGKPCKRGHVSKRRVGNGTCFQCHLEVNAKWREANPDYMSDWYQNNKDYAASRGAERYAANRDSVLIRCKEYRDANRQKVSAGWLSWVRRNPDAFRDIQRRYERTAAGKAGKFMRRCIHRTLRGMIKDDESKSLLGYERQDLIAHIESQFEPWMSWSNHGKLWHIDHIVPVAKFLDDGNFDPAIVNALSNLRPLCAKENMRKGSKI